MTIGEAFRRVRSDEFLGRGSLSHVDEAMTDQELREELRELQRDWGSGFTWSNLRRYYYGAEELLWDQVGVEPPAGRGW